MRLKHFLSVFLTLLTLSVGHVWGATFTKITSLSDLTTGDYVIIGCKTSTSYGRLTYGSLNSSRIPYSKHYNSSSAVPSSYTTTTANEIWHLVVSGTGNTRTVTIYNEGQSKYLNSGISWGTTSTDWTVSYFDGFQFAGTSNYLGVNKNTGAGTDYWKNYASSTLTSTYGITLLKAPSCNSLTMSTVTATPGDQQITLSWTHVTNASSYTVTCKNGNSNAGSIGNVSSDGTTRTCVISNLTNGTEYTWSVMPVGDGSSYCEDNTPATGDATPNVSRTITYYDKDGQHSTSLTDGTNIATALNALYEVGGPTSCNTEDYEYFVGWKDGEISGTATSVTLLSTEVVNATTAAKSYYAVWSDKDPSSGSWTQVTSVAVGDNVVIAQIDDGTKEMDAFNASATTANNYGTGATFSTNPAGTMIWTVEAGNIEGSFAFKNSSNYYLRAPSTNNNYLYGSTTIDNYSSWTIATSSSRAQVTNVGADTRVLMWNKTNTRFSTYANKSHGNNSGQYYYYVIFYKQAAVSANYITTCCTSLGSINGSFSATTQTGGILKWKQLSDKVDSWAVTCRVKNSEDEFAAVTTSETTTEVIETVTYNKYTITGLQAGKTYEFKITPTLRSGICTPLESDLIVEGSTPAAYTITAQSNDETYGTVELSGSTITGTPAQYCRYATAGAYTVTSGTATVVQEGNTFTVTPSTDCTVQINFEPIPVTGVTIKESTTEVSALTLEVGGTVDLTATVAPNTVNPAVTWTSSDPTVATVSNGTVTATQKAGTTTITATSVGDDTKSATCAITVVPVTEYKKVTSALTDWSGEYLLVYENSASEAYVWTGVEATNCYAVATISNNKIEKPTSGVKLVVAAMENEGVYSIKIVGGTNNGKYIYGTINKNEVNFSDDAEPNTISVSSGNATITSNTSFMQYNSTADQKRFRYYKYETTSQKDVQLYRKVATSAVTITAPADGTGTLSVTGASLAAVEAGSELTVTATPNSGNHYIGGTVTVTKTVGGEDVTATVYSNGTITMPEYAITVSATFTPTYEITKVADGGSIALSYTQGDAEEGYATAGTSVTATATADGSHVFTSISLSNNVENPSISENVATFTMPASAVTVTAEFAVKQDPSIVVTDGTNPITELDFGSVAKTSDPVAQTFKLSGLNLAQGTLTIESSDDTKFTVSPTSINVEGTLEETTVTVTPVTSVAGTFNDGFIMISGGGLAQADEVMIGLSLTVQETYTAKWYVNGAEQLGSTVTGIAGTALTFPDAPTPAGDCAGTEFMGWLTAPLDEASANEPTGLIKTYTGHTMPAANVNYYAVFADENPGAPSTATWVLTSDDITKLGSGTSYGDYDGNRTKGGIEFTTSNVMVGSNPNAGKIQFKASAGIIYNKTAMPDDIVSITIDGLDLAVYEGTSAVSSTPASGEISKAEGKYTFSSGKRFFHLKKKSSGAGYASSITVTYHSVTASTYSNYVTTCPHCNSVALEAAYETDPANGSITLGKSEVKTCETATVTIENTPDTGYELSAIALSDNITGASVNDAMTQITIPQGAPAGTLTVTATFAAIDYAVTMTQTGGANADLTGAKDDAHYGETINITAEDKDGYQFLGWEASPEVTFANASALSTSFTMPNEAVEVTAKYAKICTVKFYVGTTESAYATQTPHAGETVDLSSVATPSSFDATNYPNFIGWSATNFGAAVVEPALITGSEIINDDANYYAVFGNALTVETNNYAKVTAIESGKNYLVVAEASSKFYAMKNTVVSSYYIGSDEVAPVSNVITSDAAHKWQIAIPATGKMTIQNASAGYVYMYSGTGNYKDLGLREEAYQFSYTLTEGKVQLEGLSDTYVQFTAYYKNFAAKDEASDLYLYKQIINPTKWATKQIEEVTVSFNDNVAEEEITVPANEIVESGSDLDLSGFTPGARAGYQFSGWSLTTNGAVIDELSDITEDTPLYAIWAPNHTTTIKFYAKGSDDPIATHDQTQGLAYAIPDLSTSLPPVPQGFTFVGWSASQINNEAAAYTQVTSVTPDVAEADNEMALYAVYNREVTGSGDYEKVTTARADWSGQYLIVNEAKNVAFNGNINGSFDVTNNIVSVSISENTIAQSASMDNASFTFAQVEGGYSIRSHSGYYIGRTSSSTGINATEEYNASYVNTPAVNSITAGNNYLLRYNDANDQKRFRYYDGESVKGIVLYRKDDVENNYTTNPVVKYDITYLAGDAENVTGICDADRQEAGNITLCDAPTCFDKDFQGWNDGSQTYAAGAEYTLSADVTFTATWTPKPTYNVTYNTSGSQGTAPTDATDYYEGDEVTLASASGLSNAGYVFNGWSDGTQVYAAGYAEYAMPDHDVTFTATWAEISSEKWVLVTHEDALEIDGEYAIVSTFEDNNHVIQNFALGEIVTMSFNKAGQAEAVTRSGNIVRGSTAMVTFTLKAGSASGKYAFKNGDNYLTWNSGNTLENDDEVNDYSSWTITIGNEDDIATIANVAENTRKLQYNSSNPRFACYTSAQKAVQLFKKAKNTVVEDATETKTSAEVAGGDITVGDNGNLTINVSVDKQAEDLTVKNGGKLTLSGDKTLKVNNVYLSATMASGKSSQMTGTLAQLDVQGEVYFDITLGANGTNQQWHAFTVPFPVDVMSGIYDKEDNKLTNEVNYAIMEYHGDIRAKGQYGWKKIRTTLVPGTFYLMTVDGERTTYRFKKKAGEPLVAENSKPICEYPLDGGGTGDNGWNGLGNPNLFYGKVDLAVQVLDPWSYTYVTKTANSTNFVVGTPFFIQAADEGTMVMATADAGANYAPARVQANEIKDIPVSFGNEDFTDYLYVSANEDALSTYETGKDLVKMTMTNTPSVAQIFGKAYNSKLSMVYTPIVNNQAEVALELYAPQAGEYTISAPSMDNADLYLTYEGSIIWNLSMGEYTVDLNKGTTNGYGLLLVAQPNQMPTGLDTTEGVAGDAVQKILLNGQLYILRDGHLFDAVGHEMK